MNRLALAARPDILARIIRRAAPSVPDYWLEEAVGEMALQLVEQEARGANERTWRLIAIDALRSVSDLRPGGGYRSVPLAFPEWVATPPDVWVLEALRERLRDEEAEAEWLRLDERARASRRWDGLCSVTLFPHEAGRAAA